MVPRERGAKVLRLPGPGEPGFRYTEQKNLFPKEETSKKIQKSFKVKIYNL